jgi:predicted DCC family thiol-disulfide oxidoreductase YuxK
MTGGGTATAAAGARIGLPARVGAWWTRRYRQLTGQALAQRGTAALRIGYGTLWTLFLLFEFHEREDAWGPGSPWAPGLERAYEAQNNASGLIRDWLTSVAGLGDAGFEAFYLLAMLAGVLFALGWRTRISSLLFCFVVVALENRNPLITDGGDNILILMSLFLCFTRCGRHWSLDARRAERRRAGAQPAAGREPPEWLAELAAAREQIVNLLHNGAVLVIAFQICVVYGTAGLSKVQGSMWQDGSAIPYVLQLHWFQPWPALDSWVLGHSLWLAITGYLTVLVQVGFTFTVFTPRLKYASLVVIAGMHLSIAVVLGLPFFSLFMITGDAVFLSDRVWRAVGERIAGPAYAGDMRAVTGSGTNRLGLGTVPTLVFDGDCAFCTACVHWAESWCRPAVRFVPWQRLDLEAHGLTLEAVTSAVQWLPARRSDRPIPAGAAAVARTLLRSRWPFRPLGALMLVPPFSWLAAGVYRLVADNRYRLPGGTPACAVPATRPAAPQEDAAGSSAAPQASTDSEASAASPAAEQAQARLDDLPDSD